MKSAEKAGADALSSETSAQEGVSHVTDSRADYNPDLSIRSRACQHGLPQLKNKPGSSVM